MANNEKEALKEFDRKQELYQKKYSDDNFFKKLSKWAKMIGKPIVKDALTLYFALKFNKVSLSEKAMIIGALGYFIAPIDVISDFLLPLGYLDDMAVFAFILNKFSNLKKDIEIHDAVVTKLKEWF